MGLGLEARAPAVNFTRDQADTLASCSKWAPGRMPIPVTPIFANSCSSGVREKSSS